MNEEEWPLTPDERDALSEAKLVEYDLRHGKSGGLDPERHRALVESRVRRERAGRAKNREHEAAVQRIIDQAAEDGIELSWSAATDALRRQVETRAEQRKRHVARIADTYADQEAKRQAEPPLPRPPGRKKGSRSVGRQQIIDTFRALAARLQRTPTQQELADNIERADGTHGIGLRTLQELLTEYDLAWPIQ